MHETYAAVAENISTILPFVSKPRPRENTAVKAPMIINRVVILLIKYNTTMDPTGKREATMVPTRALNRVIPVCE